MAINLTLNDFRSVLGKVNDGNVVLKQNQSGIEKANYGSKVLNVFRNVRTAQNNPQENIQVRQSLLAAINNSAEGKILSLDDMERVYAALNLTGDPEADAEALAVPLSRRELKNVIDIIDSVTQNDALIKEDVAALDAKGLLDEKVSAGVQKAMDKAKCFSLPSNLKTRTAEMRRLFGADFKGRGPAEIEKFVRLNMAVIREQVFDRLYWSNPSLKDFSEGDFGELNKRFIAYEDDSVPVAEKEVTDAFKEVVGELMEKFASKALVTTRVETIVSDPGEVEPLDDDAMLRSHGMGAVDSKKIGDMIRSQELTINMKFAALMGYSRSGNKAPSLFKRQNAHLINTFESKEGQGRDVLETDQLRHRDQVEKCFFPEYGAKPIQGKDRPVYGALNMAKLTSGGADTTGAGIYGRTVVVLRPHVKQNCTYSLDDSFWTTRVSLPQAKRAELEESLVAAFASKLEDPAAVLDELRDPQSEIHRNFDLFYLNSGADSANLSALKLDALVNQIRKFFNAHLNVDKTKLNKAQLDEAKVKDGDIYAYFVERHGLKKETQALIAGYDNIENLLAQEADFTALSMGSATLMNQENPQKPCLCIGTPYIEAQFHGPVLLDRDVEEIRIDTTEMQEYFEKEFDKLPEEEQNALNQDEWIAERCQEAVAEIKRDTKNAPFKVTFYDSETTFDRESDLATEAKLANMGNAVKLLKDDFDVLGQAFLGERFGEIKEQASRYVKMLFNKANITALVGEDLEHMPDWVLDGGKAKMMHEIEKLGTDTAIYSEGLVREYLAKAFYSNLAILAGAMEHLDELGVTDPGKRETILKEITRMEVPNPTEACAYIDIHLAGEKALADLSAYVRESFEKDIEDGKELFKWAFNGLPPVSGRAETTLRQRIQDELLEIKTAIAQGTLDKFANDSESLIKRLRKNTVKPFMEPRAQITAAQTHMQFPSEGERAAFLGWATSAGELKTFAEFDGVYEGSSQLVDAFEAKIKSGAPLTAQDLLDAFKSFVGTAVDYMLEDAKGRAEYTPDNRANFIGRITSVALSRLSVRVGREGLAKIAAALDTADVRWFHTALHMGDGTNPNDFESIRGGTIELASAFMAILHQRLTEKFDLPTHPTDPPARVTYGIVPPAVRALVAQLNPEQAQRLEEMYPYDPATSGARRLANIPAPVNPAALPQNKAGRKQFLLKMLPIYHNHERTFDNGTNLHGRTHATRAFVFSITMGNILKEKGVKVDMNAVALATAGHDTGRRKSGRETADSEKRSAANTIAAVNEAYPGAAGPLWSAQIEANITSKAAEQETIEGYLFKSADSLDYSRVDDLDEERFPFLKEPIATPEGFVLPSDNGLRRQLMKEAKLLTELTAPSYPLEAEHKQLTVELGNLPNGPEFQVKTARKTELETQMRQREKAQTDNLTDQQIVDLVENAIRSRPQDFPFLTRYYLNAD